jgi:glycosyltransferase involved in cell wall biosynthesis
MLGFVDDRAVAGLVREWDLYLTTSHDEGLGLPLLELQHAGIPIVASDIPVFREVLGEAGALIDPAAPAEAAERIDAVLRGPDARGRAREAGRLNIARWNRLAANDHAAVLHLLSTLLATLGKGRP